MQFYKGEPFFSLGFWGCCVMISCIPGHIVMCGTHHVWQGKLLIHVCAKECVWGHLWHVDECTKLASQRNDLIHKILSMHYRLNSSHTTCTLMALQYSPCTRSWRNRANAMYGDGGRSGLCITASTRTSRRAFHDGQQDEEYGSH